MGQNKFFQISFFTCKKTHLIKKGSRLKLYQMFNSTSKASESWDLEVFGKVPRSWDSPGATGIFPKTQSPGIFQDYIFLHQGPQSPKVLGQSRDAGTAPKTQKPDMF